MFSVDWQCDFAGPHNQNNWSKLKTSRKQSLNQLYFILSVLSLLIYSLKMCLKLDTLYTDDWYSNKVSTYQLSDGCLSCTCWWPSRAKSTITPRYLSNSSQDESKADNLPRQPFTDDLFIRRCLNKNEISASQTHMNYMNLNVLFLKPNLCHKSSSLMMCSNQ